MFGIEHSGEHYGQLVVYYREKTWCRRTRGGKPVISLGSSQLRRVTRMKHAFPLLAVLSFTVTALGQGTKSAASAGAPQMQQQQPPPTIASTVDRQISTVEKQLEDTAEAMPEDKFNFSPESLNIPGANYKGVRTFALQVKHVAASNYAIWSHLTGDQFRADFLGGNGPENLKSKADILKFLKDSLCSGSQGRGHANCREHVADRGE
jgi:hypothetical protein